ncbi:hypothetical protein LSH36_648g00018 [Paralvinella palmiformis]|uniref:Uncharacterized protein n=1 Tax=Paralvinella palmiformis TaxID=53620 RepID=A0AAD9J4H7_9ANNE|nr:hypothetical protein LSH36_648g00018 [Paralvinella palmiformis]
MDAGFKLLASFSFMKQSSEWYVDVKYDVIVYLLTDDFLQDQVKIIKMVSDMISNVKRVGAGLGVYMFDKNLEDKISRIAMKPATPDAAADNCDGGKAKDSFGHYNGLGQ